MFEAIFNAVATAQAQIVFQQAARLERLFSSECFTARTTVNSQLLTKALTQKKRWKAPPFRDTNKAER